MGDPPEVQLQALEAELGEVEGEIERLLHRQQLLQAQREQLCRAIAVNTRAPKADWHKSFAWDAAMMEHLATDFGLQQFRPLQREVCNATLQGRDVLCLLPSGGGKSLCYQLPAMLSTGVTLVVSPLLSLIQDQVLGLQRSGIKALALTSLTPKEAITSMYQQMETDLEVKLIYVTPERIVAAKRFMGKLDKLYKAARLSRIAIDEAHCCSQWGNDFRPDYKKLGVLKQQFPDTPIIALTATATQRVCSDLKTLLRVEACETFSASVNRPNLLYEVHSKPKTLAEQAQYMMDWINATFPNGDSGIVYCLTRKDTEQVAVELSQHGLACGCYHADMDPHHREDVHLQWSSGRLQLIVATIAFGMGINKPDVRFVIHHSLSKSLENYYQESGRAGRDGQPARCLLLHRFSDAMRQAGIVSYEPTWQPNLYAVMQYAATLSSCRRALICRHFAEAPAPCGNMCDNCQRGHVVQRTDTSAAAAGVLMTLHNVAAADKRLTLTQLIDTSCKAQDTVKALSKDQCDLLIAHLLQLGVLQLDFGYTAYATNTYLKAAPRASQILAGKPVMLEHLDNEDSGLLAAQSEGRQQAEEEEAEQKEKGSRSKGAQPRASSKGKGLPLKQKRSQNPKQSAHSSQCTSEVLIISDEDTDFEPDQKVAKTIFVKT